MKKCMTLMAIALTCVALAGNVDAGSLSLDGFNGHGITGTFDGNSRTEYGGVVTGFLDGHPVNTYCGEAFVDIGVPSTNPVDVTNDGTLHGYTVSNRDEIAWLMTYVAPGVGSNPDKQNGLQAAIWHLVSPSTGHSFDMASVSPGYGYYTADLAAAFDKSAPLSNVLWISPYDSSNGNPLQGQLAAASVPEPSTLALLVLGAIGLTVGACRRRRATAV